MVNVECDIVIQWIKWVFVIVMGKFFDVYICNGVVFQFQNVRLNVMQQVIWCDIDKGVQFLVVFQVRKEINVVVFKFIL